MERFGLGEIIEEAVLDHRADGDLRARPQRLHGLGTDVGRVMADQLKRFSVGAGEKLDRGVGQDRFGKVGERAIEHHGDRALQQRWRDGLRHICAGGAGRDGALGAIGHRQLDIGHR